MSRLLLPFVLLSLSCSTAFAASYGATKVWLGNQFTDAFAVENIADPTHGRVNYVDFNTAQNKGLIYTDPNTNHFVLRADSWTYLDPNGAGRDSVRLTSKDTFTEFVAVYDIHHMPQGCGTWPAVWTVGDNWPYNGEIDILEGVNDQGPNAATLHTSPGCTMPWSRGQTGTTLRTNCDTAVEGNAGCGVQMQDKPNSYGPAFNNNGGGWYVVERGASEINVWFFGRNGVVPDAVRNGADHIDTAQLGTPTANFPNSECDINSHFGPQRLVINLTFCGDWAGSVYGNSGCPGSCVDFVNNNPNSFSEAYFDFESLRVYQPN